jgi:hypothetical protein
MHRMNVFLLATTCSLAIVTQARADCAAGARYDPVVTNNTVTVGLENTSRTCPDASGMLRQNEATGEVDLLASYCVMGADGNEYADECVAPGTYRYGLALPYSCSEKGCGGGPEFFTEVTVTAALSPSCARASTDPGPTVTNEAPPWGTGATPAQFQSCPGVGCACDTATASVASMNALALGVGIGIVLMARKRKRA